MDGNSFTNSLPFVSEHVHVKKPTSQFVVVSGFGFRIEWNGKSTVYITLEPVFLNKVGLYRLLLEK